METATVGRVVVQAKILNLNDVLNARRGQLPEDQIRAVAIEDALVDTGATHLGLPPALIARLGLRPDRTGTAQTTAGPRPFTIYEPVRLMILDRAGVAEVAEVPEGCPVLIGQIPLEVLDLVVDLKRRRLVGNPQHGGEWMFDMF